MGRLHPAWALVHSWIQAMGVPTGSTMSKPQSPALFSVVGKAIGDGPVFVVRPS
jgi:hypothetical protein